MWVVLNFTLLFNFVSIRRRMVCLSLTRVRGDKRCSQKSVYVLNSVCFLMSQYVFPRLVLFQSIFAEILM